MSRKKVNPNRVPVGPGDYNLEQIKNQAANGKVLQTWAILLAALSNLEGMTTVKLLDIWQQIDQVPTQIHTFDAFYPHDNRKCCLYGICNHRRANDSKKNSSFGGTSNCASAGGGYE